jgi:hypothetical protein
MKADGLVSEEPRTDRAWVRAPVGPSFPTDTRLERRGVARMLSGLRPKVLRIRLQRAWKCWFHATDWGAVADFETELWDLGYRDEFKAGFICPLWATVIGNIQEDGFARWLWLRLPRVSEYDGVREWALFGLWSRDSGRWATPVAFRRSPEDVHLQVYDLRFFFRHPDGIRLGRVYWYSR